MVRKVRLECKKALRGRIWDGWYRCVVGEGDLSFRVVVDIPIWQSNEQLQTKHGQPWRCAEECGLSAHCCKEKKKKGKGKFYPWNSPKQSFFLVNKETLMEKTALLATGLAALLASACSFSPWALPVQRGDSCPGCCQSLHGSRARNLH